MKIIFVFLLFSSVSSLFAQTSLRIELRLISAGVVASNHVGNSWAYDVLVEMGEDITSLLREPLRTYVLNCRSDSRVFITAIAQESDTRPDVGSQNRPLNLNRLIDEGAYQETIDVIVTENGGRYSGNTAMVRFVIQVRLIQ